MSQDLEKHLKTALGRLERAYDEILKTQGYTRETEKLKMLVEMTREQVRHENISPATRQTR